MKQSRKTFGGRRTRIIRGAVLAMLALILLVPLIPYALSAVSGVAVFDDLSLDQIADGYTLTATASGLTEATSNTFNIVTGQLAFAVQPSNAEAGVAISPAITVEVRDDQGALIPTASNSITIAIGDNPGGGILSGTATVSAVNGVATFSDLSIDKVGTAYTLTASSTDLVSATSDPFDITPGAAAQLAFRTEPSDAAAGTAISPAIEVEIRDAGGNLVSDATNAVTIAIDTNPGGGTLSGTATQNAVNGVQVGGIPNLSRINIACRGSEQTSAS